ncbi:haloacid dehalogenase superfamily, subfamily IA, variant 3 with third motif having DD or ED/beta-phosphoglucomutase family hydrolase [Tessaracoccus bendigoensis DSM 12906]|uniref:Beta-phosphoglucomutase n=1 Tax=Tessaracoccus bendigoensis DSM 12906 TaxID=1123357 RepID=A0A1M6C2B0_9ACTN|nr:beta-phosphoglucomutase family hydrolase [Tessaracoccus bendigoensis]SHI55140.1 haloacid dehalogenase superfamily, subfamily IA, variant 3 with third motif having DD or ED/beta-phosphoglucomutase family hydrolase [Tessaracoccus bendigoensis DSM 12906]
MTWSNYRAILFDLDGVITPTAEVHMRAWRQVFEPFLTGLPDQEPYTEHDYFTHIDGKARIDGVRDLLASRGLVLPEGSPDDDPASETVVSLGNRKNQAFRQIITDERIRPYPGSEELVRELAAAGFRLAIVSSSRNARVVLESTGLADLFEVVVDGEVVAHDDIEGKPAPDAFKHAAALLGVPENVCVVVEDATVGVEAGAAGGFGLVIGVDRGTGADALLAAGADLVVTDLSELVGA